ncbi:GSCFA domain-containing protein [Pseudemcibacter aquimaris]|uniref:GSCFA domain-containing protein n=1 Tax=Pseudemcibacter aquimaris TaxID=2857064 RepID=UPI0020115E40|nr:GSCFA domain-containing protein [Pseudemcibacter aquimaris]MCC3859687.1 GSCFA domain-containing protein [Pseudemcibacter aquimaris]WDU60082.1 GSCFA domain-containing protein [Pseudemcibacter aquimaris]
MSKNKNKEKKNPYSNLPDNRFWKTGVKERQPQQFYEDLWKPKFKIKKQSNIVAAGSCFAQHVGKWLSDKGYSFYASSLDSLHNFSFAFGNIYTCALLRELLEAALGKCDLSNIVHQENGRWFDLLRPVFNEDGYESKDALVASREEAFGEMLESIKNAEVFIFTLGLTESWIDNDGVVYPMCPGTLCGEFDKKKYSFKNYSFEENIDELEQVLELIKSVNSKINVLLTVSPVPLTATASQNHVLSATTYSKSILRSVAERMKEKHSNVDYFPSYEIINSVANKGIFFEENLRSVTPNGVSYVMSHFEAGISPYEFKKALKKQQKEAEFFGSPNVGGSQLNGDAVCEEETLEGQRNSAVSSDPVKFFLIGDSHMGFLSKCFAKRNISHCGGALMNGSAWEDGLFHLTDEDYIVMLENKGARHFWENAIETVKNTEKQTGKKPIIVTNVGYQTHRSMAKLIRWFKTNNLGDEFNLEETLKYFSGRYDKHIQFLQNLVEAGFKVIALPDPPIFKNISGMEKRDSYMFLYESVYDKFLEKIGVKIFNVREWREKTKGLSKDIHIFKDGEPDWIHGSPAYYQELVDKIVKTYS